MDTIQLFADIINFLPDATLVIDRDGKVIAWNHAIEEMTGVKAVEMLGKDDYEYAIPFYGIRRPVYARMHRVGTSSGYPSNKSLCDPANCVSFR